MSAKQASGATVGNPGEPEGCWTTDGFRALYRNSRDVIIEEFICGAPSCGRVTLVYANGLCDDRQLHEVVLPALYRMDEQEAGELSPLDRLASRLSLRPMTVDSPIDIVDESIFQGDLLLLFGEAGRLYRMNLAHRPQRAPEESNTEISIKGPKDGFTEDIDVNIALIRKRVRANTLHVESFVLGRRTKTRTALLYFEDMLDEKTLQEVRSKLREIDMDGVYTINQLEESLTGSKLKLLPLLDYTGRPDYCVTSLLSGRFLIILDGNPLVIVGPSGLSLILKSPEDIHFNYVYVSFARLIRLFSLFLTVFLPAIWVALMAFHQDQVPFRIMATIAVSRLGLPFPSQLEILILLMLLEIFREAGVRLPTVIGQTLTSIGGLIIGDAAIRAGLVSPSVVVIGAVTAVSSVTLVNQSLSTIVSVLRFFFFGLACYLGMYGVILGIIIFLAYMASQKSFSRNYLAPLSPLNVRELPMSFLRVPWFAMKRRPAGLRTRDDRKQGG